MRRVWLVRHGESTSNVGQTSAEPAAVPLTTRGEQQATEVAERVPEPPALIVSSPYRRAAQTAAPTITRFPTTPHEVWPVQEFSYLGDLHGTVTTPEERRPISEEYWARADPELSIGGAETFTGLVERASGFLARLATRAEDPVVVFTHGFFIRAVAWVLVTGTTAPDQDAMRSFRRFVEAVAVPNAAVVPLRFPDTGPPKLVAGHAW